MDPDGGTALLYECHARYRTGEEDEGRRWVVRSDIVELTGETREVFYSKDNAVCYAGTFEADTDLYIHEIEDYRKLAPKVRQILVFQSLLRTLSWILVLDSTTPGAVLCADRWRVPSHYRQGKGRNSIPVLVWGSTGSILTLAARRV